MGSSGRRNHNLPDDFPPARTFRPTLEEFQDFPAYIKKLEEQDCHKTGICKIVCPEEWVPRRAGYDDETFDFMIQRPVMQKMCPVGEDRGIKGAYQAKSSSHPEGPMTIRAYRQMAPKFEKKDDLSRLKPLSKMIGGSSETKNRFGKDSCSCSTTGWRSGRSPDVLTPAMARPSRKNAHASRNPASESRLHRATTSTPKRSTTRPTNLPTHIAAHAPRTI